MKPDVLRVTGLSKHFPGVQALDTVDLEVRPAEVHALVGENGAGKSTLIKILAGAQQPDRGRIEVDGEIVTIDHVAQSTALGLAFVHQDLNLVPRFSALENIMLGLPTPRRFGLFVDWRSMRARAEEVGRRLRIDFDLSTAVAELSVAQQVMVVLCRALLLDAKLVVMDEPTAALSATEVERLYDLVRDLTGHGVAVVYVSHRLEEVFALADRITVLKDGRKVGTYAREELEDKRHLTRLIVGREGDDHGYTREPEPGAVLLEARGLSHGFVHDVSFELRAGEILGLAGLVGSGRSEVAHMLFGALTPEAGEIVVDGTPHRALTTRAAIASGIALVPEDRHAQAIVTNMSVRENATLASLGKYRVGPFIKRSRETAAVRSIVRRLGVKTATIKQPIRNLSGGNQQKVVIGKWIDTDARVFLLDEPTQGVDVGARQEVYRIVEDLADSGAAVLFISSDLDEVVRIADRVVVMREGRVAAELDRAEVSLGTILAHCFATDDVGVAEVL